MLPRRYRFGRFELDVGLRELRRDGETVSLPLKSFDCLVYLLERRERAVGRDELISAVWGRVDVSDALLGQTLARARRALEDTGEAQRVIRTVPRFGYRWMAPVTVLEVGTAGAEERPDAGTTDVVEEADVVEADTPVEAASHTRAAPPVQMRGGRWKAAVAALALAVAIAIAVAVWMVRHRSLHEAPGVPVAVAGAYLVLPVSVAEADAASRWIRLGGMDYLASALRERGGLPVLPSEQVVAYLGEHDAAQIAGSAQRLRLARETGAAGVLSATARRVGSSWSFDLDVQDAEQTKHFHGEAAAPLAAADQALGAFLAQLGRTAAAVPEAAPDRLELQQRIDSAFLEGDLRQASELIEAAPVALQHDPAIAVRAAEVDDRAGRSALAETGFRRIVDATGVPEPIRARAFYGLCAIDYRRYQLDAATGYCADALTAAKDQPDPMLLGRVHMLRAVIDGELGHDDEAMAGFGLARLEWQRAGNLPGQASVDGDIGLAETRRNRFAEAVAAFDRAVAIFERFGITDHLASALAAKSDAQRQMLDIGGALESSTRAWQLATQVENARSVLAIGYSHALNLLAGGRFDEAAHVIDRFDAAAPTAPAEFAVLRRRLLAEQGHPQQAIEQADALIDKVLAPPDPTSDASLSEAVQVLADAALEMGDKALVGHLLARLHDAGESSYDPDRDFVADLVRAHLAVAQGDPAAADRHFASALNRVASENRPDLIVAAASDYVLFLLAQGRNDDATRVAGRLALYADKAYAAARATFVLYEKLGDVSLAEQARTRMRRLAGQRSASPDSAAAH